MQRQGGGYSIAVQAPDRRDRRARRSFTNTLDSWMIDRDA